MANGKIGMAQAFQLFQRGVQSANIATAFERGSSLAKEIKEDESLDELEKRKALRNLSQEVVGIVAGMGGTQGQIASANKAFGPPKLEQIDPTQLIAQGIIEGDDEKVETGQKILKTLANIDFDIRSKIEQQKFFLDQRAAEEEFRRERAKIRAKKSPEEKLREDLFKINNAISKVAVGITINGEKFSTADELNIALENMPQDKLPENEQNKIKFFKNLNRRKINLKKRLEKVIQQKEESEQRTAAAKERGKTIGESIAFEKMTDLNDLQNEFNNTADPLIRSALKLQINNKRREVEAAQKLESAKTRAQALAKETNPKKALGSIVSDLMQESRSALNSGNVNLAKQLFDEAQDAIGIAEFSGAVSAKFAEKQFNALMNFKVKLFSEKQKEKNKQLTSKEIQTIADLRNDISFLKGLKKTMARRSNFTGIEAVGKEAVGTFLGEGIQSTLFADFAEFKSRVERGFQKIRKHITGAQASFAEIELLRPIFPKVTRSDELNLLQIDEMIKTQEKNVERILNHLKAAGRDVEAVKNAVNDDEFNMNEYRNAIDAGLN